jgi:transcriptional regulator with XRE-family HTH domain
MSEGTHRPEPPREALLLDAARRRASLSIREAAKRAGMSDARWRQIATGYQRVGGQEIPVRAPADTLARMAQVLGLTPEELERVGRDDAAEVLAEISPIAQSSENAHGYSPPVEAVYQILASLPPDAQQAVIRRLASENPAAIQPFARPDRQAG